jgi:hypothetical protein
MKTFGCCPSSLVIRLTICKDAKHHSFSEVEYADKNTSNYLVDLKKHTIYNAKLKLKKLRLESRLD